LVTRLVVPSKTVGCILGEGGKVITEMRRRIGAEIRVYSKADKPKYLSFDEELVQVILYLIVSASIFPCPFLCLCFLYNLLLCFYICSEFSGCWCSRYFKGSPHRDCFKA
jgi:hypothetical protein